MNSSDGVLSVVDKVVAEVGRLLSQSNGMRSLVMLVLSIGAAYLLSHLVGKLIIAAADFVAVRSDNATDKSKALKLRRLETYLSVALALIRSLIVGFVAFFVWQAISPAANLSTAAIGAGAFFVVIAGATMGMILRDVTAGSAMIVERWFNVGDFIRVEPFSDVSGVVEKMTLRSTKLRSLNGEAIWLHNQHIQAAKVTEGGLRTLAVDVFVKHEEAGKKLIADAIAGIPVGPLTLARPLEVISEEQWTDKLWTIEVVGQTPPGREWLIEDFFVECLKELDEKNPSMQVLARKPIVRHADPRAERSFRRAVRAQAKAKVPLATPTVKI